jgi:hypothetical protein
VTDGLRGQGFRFVYRAGTYMWLHPVHMQNNDIDCTDMDDAEFEAFTRERGWRPLPRK